MSNDLYMLLDTVGVGMDIRLSRDGYVTHEAVMEGGFPREDRIAPRYKYHCAGCDIGFDKPVFMKVEG